MKARLKASRGVHDPMPNGPIQGERQRAIPPARFEGPRTSTCVCGKDIRTSAFGWIHQENAWVRLGECANAKPKE